MNNIIITGRLCKANELRYSSGQNQTAVLRNTLAVDRGGRDKGTDFINFVVFGKSAENMQNFTEKGCRVLVQGRLELGSYDKDGAKVYTTTVIAERVEFLDFKAKESGTKQEPEQFENFNAIDEIIPF